MMKYKVSGRDTLLLAFYAELEVQFMIFDRAYETLYNQHLYSQGDRSAKTCSPIKLMTDYALFLNSAAMINKILGLSKGKGRNNGRAKKLRSAMRLEKGDVPTLAKVDLRNSMEHVDERLDLLAQENPSELILWDLTDSYEVDNVLRKFNPEDFTMQCLGRDLSTHTLWISDCYNEVQHVKLSARESRDKIGGKINTR